MRSQYTTSHWGVYEVRRNAHGDPSLHPHPDDPDPSPIGLHMLAAYRSPLRVQRPAVRESWLRDGPGARPEARGRERFVEVGWDEAARLVAREIARVRETHGNEAIFGGSYGWSSAGRFHHAQSQVHRFLNAAGGYVRHVDSYSLGAGRAVMPHIVAPMERLLPEQTAWPVLAEHTKLMVCFGGVPAKNAQITGGGATRHHVRPGLAGMAANGCRFVNLSPVSANLDAPEAAVEHVPVRPGTDTAVMLAMAHVLVRDGLYDAAFVETHCTGFARWRAYLAGESDGVPKTPAWAQSISGVPAARIERLARELVGTRSMISVAWSLQRADHGEQPFWAAIGLASLVGQIGLPGGGFGFGYGPANGFGSPHRRIAGPTLPQGHNAVDAFIPVARIADMLLAPGASFTYNGASRRYPDIRLVMWAGGNPFHHHQDLNRLVHAWRKPETIVVNEQFWNAHARMADVVLPATSTLERDDIAYAAREPYLVAMRAVIAPPGEARDDYAIYGAIARELGCAQAYTEGRDVEDWLRWMWDDARARNPGLPMPDYDAFRAEGIWRVPDVEGEMPVLLGAFRADPVKHRLATPSGRIELFSERVASFGLDDCPGYACWREPHEWLGAPAARRHRLHLISDQPDTKLHSQLDHSTLSRAARIHGREPVWIHPDDARERGIRDGAIVRVFNDRGACLAGAHVTDAVMPGVLKLSTGAWFDPTTPGEPGSLERHGNPNVLTADRPTSSLTQGCTAQSCLVEVEPYRDAPPEIGAFAPPLATPR